MPNRRETVKAFVGPDLERGSFGSPESLAAALSRAPVAVALADADGRLVAANDELGRLLGRTPESLVSLPYESLVAPAARPFESALARALLSGEQTTHRGRCPMLTARGQPLETEVVAWTVPGGNVLRLESGEVEVQPPLLMRLIEPVHPEGAKEQGAGELQSMPISTVSHELRSPLALIVGYSDFLLNRTVDEPKRRQILERINVSAKRLSRLIDDILSVSRIESGRHVVRSRQLDVRAAVEEVLSHRTGDRSFVLNIPDGLPQVMADPDILVQILLNLVDNAVKYSEREITVSAWREESMVWIAVSDRGVGLSEAEMAQLFERFFRSERPEVRAMQGTGLGLFITRSLVELLGGEIRVASELDRGTTFRFTLPAAHG
ncbi:MAG TPA: ATP-binding protein [Actinomycetota bacterium]|jgi:PAS domain S-box-containing protein